MAAAETISTGVYQVRPVASLKPYEKNARTHSAEQRSQLTRSECAELIEYVLAWAAEHGINTGDVDPETGEIQR